MAAKKKKAAKKKRKGDPKGADALEERSYQAARIGDSPWPVRRKASQRRRAEETAYGTQMRHYTRGADPSGTKEMFIPVLHLPWETYKANKAKAAKKAKAARKKAKHKSRMKKIRSAVTKGLKKAGVTRGSSTKVTWKGDN